MDRLTLVLSAEAAVLAALSTLLLVRATPTTARIAGFALAACTALVVVMALAPRRVLAPFVKAVGVCRVCGARASARARAPP